ncbi:Bax inhibitor-1/YccA family protein [Granulicoccus phenolivorans]|uniref:Bax inhibitor-1/YccA family protein n=1 Tax=Granulicoccus phenolivorans TaxID=266854 RepID=UPI00040F8CB5|nr:Bax inhibitor-1/YccA family protein [Granulicoccus phenolivorans]
MRTANPILTSFDRPEQTRTQGRPETPMTFDDVVAKTMVTMGLALLAAIAVYALVPAQYLWPVTIGASIASVIAALVVAFARSLPAPAALIVVVLEGAMIGGLSKSFEMVWPGIVSQAVLATFIAAGVTLAAYKFFNVRVTPRFRKIVFIATAAFAVTMLVNFVLSLAGIDLGLRGAGGGVSFLAIIVSAIGVVLATLNLVLDFDHIENGIRNGAPASESWRAAYGLTVTLIWLYVEILRILSYFRD